MSSASTTASYSSLRVNSWPTEAIELDLTASALSAGAFHDLDEIIQAAPTVFPTSPPIVETLADPDYGWDVATTPIRIHAFLTAFAIRCPHIPPSAYLETLYLTHTMFSFIWGHPVIVRNITQELELFFMRTFWNVAVRYDPKFTEEVFHELTEHRYVRCLDPSSKLILQRQMNVEDRTFEQRGDMIAFRVKMCVVFADWADEVEVKYNEAQLTIIDPSIATTFNWVEESASMVILPSELESLADVAEALEEALSADIDLSEELEAEAVDLSMSLSNRVITDTPTSTMSAPAMVGAIPDITVNSPVVEIAINVGVNSDKVEVDEVDIERAIFPVEATKPAEGSGATRAYSLRPPSLAVRTRPPYGSQSTTPSEASLNEDTSESTGPQTPDVSVGVFPFVFMKSQGSFEHGQAPSVSSSTTGASSGFGTFSKGSFMSGSMFGTTDMDSFITSLPSIPSFKTSRLPASGIKGSSLASAGSSTTNTSGSDSDGSLPTDRSLSADSGRITPDDTEAGPSSSSSKFGSFMRRLVKRRGNHKGKGNAKEENDLTSPGVMVDHSEFDLAMGIEFFDNRVPYHAIGWGGQPMKPKGPLAQLLSIPKLYWELKMAERRGEA